MTKEALQNSDTLIIRSVISTSQIMRFLNTVGSHLSELQLSEHVG